MLKQQPTTLLLCAYKATLWCKGVTTVYWQTFVTLQFADNNEKILTVV